MENHQDSVTFPNRLTGGFMQRFCPNPYATFDLIALYREFNALYFNGDLRDIRVTSEKDENDETWEDTSDIQWDGRYRKVYGKYIYNNRQIRLAKHMVFKPNKVKSTLLHEMLHKYLHQTSQDDGIEGHGPNFIKEAKRINDLCRERNAPYRVEFYDEEITREEPVVFADLIGTEVACFKDLDLARKVKAICEKAFHTEWEYRQ